MGSELKLDLRAIDKIHDIANDVKVIRELVQNQNPRVLNEIIHTHDIATLIMEQFENLLNKYDIMIPDEGREDLDDEENKAPIYGMTYANLLDGIETQIIDELKRILPEECFSDDDKATESTRVITGIYSGTI